MHVLYTSGTSASIVEQKNGEEGSEASREKLHVGGLRQADQVKEVTTAEEAELVAEASRVIGLVASTHVEWLNARVDLILVVPQLRLLVGVDKVLDTLLVLLLDLPFVQDSLTSCLFLKLDLLDRHHGHEVVGGVAQIWALELNRAEVVDGQARLIHEDDLAARKQHQSIEHLKDIRVGLMDGANNCAILFPGEVAEDLHDVSGSERIQTSGWLIKEDQTRIGDQLDSDGATFALTAGNALNEGSTDAGVSTFRQLQVVDELLNTIQFLAERALEL